MTARSLYCLIIVTAAFVGCSGTDGSNPVATRSLDAILPTKSPTPVPTPSASFYSGSDYIVHASTSTAAKHELFVFLPGSGANPSDYNDIVNEAGAQGFDAVGLHYDNDTEVAKLCASSGSATPDPNCYGLVRAATAVGGTVYSGASTLTATPGPSATTIISVPTTSSIESNLASVIRTYFPSYLNGTQIDWSHIVLSGHSQGGGTAAFIAKELHAVPRVCFFSDPAESGATWLNETAQPVPWPYGSPFPASTPPAQYPRTPGSRYWALDNDQDTAIVTISEAEAAWNALAIPTPIFTGVTTVPPTNGAHQLVTSVGSSLGSGSFAEHNETAVDLYTPKTKIGGNPQLLPIWDAMCFN
jgi:hypothetical protein